MLRRGLLTSMDSEKKMMTALKLNSDWYLYKPREIRRDRTRYRK